jgi:hypothetical protein
MAKYCDGNDPCQCGVGNKTAELTTTILFPQSELIIMQTEGAPQGAGQRQRDNIPARTETQGRKDRDKGIERQR